MSYEDGLIHAVDVERKPATPTRGARGGDTSASSYAVVEAGVPCRVMPAKAAEQDQFAKRSVRVTHRVHLPAGTRLDDSHRLAFADPATGQVRHLIVQAAYDPHESGLRYLAFCEEQPN